MKVLVIDDDSGVLASTERLLTARGHTVWSAHDPDDANTVMAEHGAPDVLLTDVVFGGGTGVDYARALRARHPAMRVIFMTGLIRWEPPALRTGLGPVLRKPFSAESLYAAVEGGG